MKRKYCGMRLRMRFVVIGLLLMLGLSGCFQQAGTAMQEPIVSNQGASDPGTSVPLPTEDATAVTGQDGTTPLPPAATDAIVTQPDTSSGDDGNPPVALTIISATIAPVATTTVNVEPTTAEGSQLVDAQGTPVEMQFITPSGPLGPITQVPIAAATNAGAATATPSGLVTPTAFASLVVVEGCTHTVQSGDTLYRIALKYEVSLADLRQVNPQVTGDIIQPGDELTIPDCTGDDSTSSTAQPAQPTTPPTALPGGSQTYVVKRGDTLYSIAIQFGITMNAIQQANSLDNPDRLSPGQELIIPPKSG